MLDLNFFDESTLLLLLLLFLLFAMKNIYIFWYNCTVPTLCLFVLEPILSHISSHLISLSFPMTFYNALECKCSVWFDPLILHYLTRASRITHYFWSVKVESNRLLASTLSDQLMAFSLYSFQNLFQLCFSKPENQDLKTSNKVISFFLLPENWFHKHLKFILYYQNLMYTIKNLTIKCFWFDL